MHLGNRHAEHFYLVVFDSSQLSLSTVASSLSIVSSVFFMLLEQLSQNQSTAPAMSDVQDDSITVLQLFLIAEPIVGKWFDRIPLWYMSDAMTHIEEFCCSGSQTFDISSSRSSLV